MSFSVALQLYSIEDEMAKDFVHTLEKVKEMGYEGVEFAGFFGKSAQQVKEVLNKTGLIPVAAHVPIGEMFTDTKKIMETYSNIGFKFIVIPYLPEKLRPGSCDFGDTLSDIKHLCEQAREYGLTMLYHNHDFEFEIINGEYYLDTIYSTISEDLLKTEIDTCWVKVAGEDPSAYIIKYSGRSPVVHIKDYSMKGTVKPEKMYELIGIEPTDKSESSENFSFRPVGYGVQNIPKLLRAAEKAGASWIVVEQDEPAKGQTAMESAELSREYLKKMGY